MRHPRNTTTSAVLAPNGEQAPSRSPAEPGKDTADGRASLLSRSVRERLAFTTARPGRRRTPAAVGRLRTANAALRAENQALLSSLQRFQEFAGEVSHDLKTPLIAILGYAELLNHLDSRQLEAEEYHGLLGQIISGAERMREVIDNVLQSLSNRDEITVQPIDLGALATESARECRDRFGTAPSPSKPQITVDRLPPAFADAVMIRRVFDNLLGNAVKYVRPGQVARVHVSGRTETGGWVRVDVTDNGIGIPDGQHELVFAGRYRAHADAGYPGTGLGLAICRKIIEMHGGLIIAEPAETGGTRVWFTLPDLEPAGPPTLKQHHHSR